MTIHACFPLVMLVTVAAAQVRIESLPIDFTRSHRDVKVTGLSRKACGVSPRDPRAGARIESAVLPAPMVFSSVSASWRSTAQEGALAVKLRTSPNKRQWSDWTIASGDGALRDAGSGQTVSRPVMGRGGYVQFTVEWKPGVEPGCLSEIVLQFVGEGESPVAPAGVK